MKLKYIPLMNSSILISYQIDAFSDQIFSGNPAAVVPLDNWLPDETLQSIAMEHKHSETAFIVKNEGDYDLRWFTPTKEVPLCGHATLASAHALFNHLHYKEDSITFQSKSGPLIVKRVSNCYELDFPIIDYQEININEAIQTAVDITSILAAYQGGVFIMLILDTEESVRNFIPDMTKISNVDSPGLLITARGNQADFVSRLFAPNSGIPEDPVTGSAHCILTPYWSKVLNKHKLEAKQISQRGGILSCQLTNERVLISGSAKTYSKSEIYLD